MRKELDEALVAKYPLIFADRNGDMDTTAMCWGFDCGDGWYNILDILCGTIQSYINDRNRSVAHTKARNKVIYEHFEGNPQPLLDFAANPKLVNLYLKLGIQEEPLAIPQVVATQVKDKFGALRFYYNGGDDYISGMVTLAENLSQRTCDICGAPGQEREGPWIVTRCDAHKEI